MNRPRQITAAPVNYDALSTLVITSSNNPATNTSPVCIRWDS
jgi:hypothetical protein